MDNNTPVYDFEDAINFISERCDTSKEIIETILMLEEDYMRSIGIISDEEPDIKWNFQVEGIWIVIIYVFIQNNIVNIVRKIIM